MDDWWQQKDLHADVKLLNISLKLEAWYRPTKTGNSINKIRLIKILKERTRRYHEKGMLLAERFEVSNELLKFHCGKVSQRNFY